MARSEAHANDLIASTVIGRIAHGMHVQSERERFAAVLAKAPIRRAVRRSLVARLFGR